MTFKDSILAEMERTGITPKELGSMWTVSKQIVADWISGEGEPLLPIQKLILEELSELKDKGQQ
jgi:predicted transcriptional regulator